MSKVYVYLWFDIEDYVTKEADDPTLIFLNILRKQKVPVTCKLVAEEVRALVERGRTDVLSAISECDVGYHSDTHSQHPTVWEYLAERDLSSGAKEFLSREEGGVQLIREVFHRVPTCYGHPGVMWAPHVYPALCSMGISMYLDETKILNLNNEPYWYCGMLNLNGAGRNLIYFDYSFEKPDGIVALKSKVRRIYKRLSKSTDGGAVSICLHPHTAVNKTTWDIVNFARGENRAKEEYERPPAQPEAVTKRAYKDFDEFIRYISSFENVQWITAKDALEIYRSPERIVLDREELMQVAKHFLSSSKYLKTHHTYLSPAEGFYLIAKFLGEYADSNMLPTQMEVKQPLGPAEPFKSKGALKLSTRDLLASSKAASTYMTSEKMIPSSLKVGNSAELSPHDFLSTACKLVIAIRSGHVPERVTLKKGSRPLLSCLKRAAFEKDCRWIVLPRRFAAPKIFEQACLQAWTLKPAIANNSTAPIQRLS